MQNKSNHTALFSKKGLLGSRVANRPKMLSPTKTVTSNYALQAGNPKQFVSYIMKEICYRLCFALPFLTNLCNNLFYIL